MIKCPKCKGKQLKFIEYFVEPMLYYQNENGFLLDNWQDGPIGFVEKTKAFCLKCKYSWTLKKSIWRAIEKRSHLDYYIINNKEKFEQWLKGEFNE